MLPLNYSNSSPHFYPVVTFSTSPSPPKRSLFLRDPQHESCVSNCFVMSKMQLFLELKQWPGQCHIHGAALFCLTLQISQGKKQKSFFWMCLWRMGFCSCRIYVLVGLYCYCFLNRSRLAFVPSWGTFLSVHVGRWFSPTSAWFLFPWQLGIKSSEITSKLHTDSASHINSNPKLRGEPSLSPQIPRC